MTAIPTLEYLVIPESDRARLGELGTAGWELVGTGGEPAEPLLYLKRPGLNFRERVTLSQREHYLASLAGADANSERQR